MIYSSLERLPALADILASCISMEAGKAYDRLQGRGIGWVTERESARDKRPPQAPVLFQSEFTDAGPRGSDRWDLGILFRHIPVPFFPPLYDGHPDVWQADQFMILRSRSRVAGCESNAPMGRVVHGLMFWFFCFSEDGQRVKTKGVIDAGNVSPFGAPFRMLAEEDDPYHPLACPWGPLATFGLLNHDEVAATDFGNSRLKVEW